MDASGALRAATDQVATYLDAITAEDWTKPTPCDGWTVANLVGHLVTGADWYVRLLSYQAPTAIAVGPRPSAPEGSARYQIAADRIIGLANALEPDASAPYYLLDKETGFRAVNARISDFVDSYVVDITVHSWDLASSITAHLDRNEELDRFALEAADRLSWLMDLVRTSGQMRPARPTDGDETPLVQLLRFTGRATKP